MTTDRTAAGPVPTHLLPDACYVCGGEKHADTAEHNYWSNADAERALAAEAARHSRPGYTEARYVDETRGR